MKPAYGTTVVNPRFGDKLTFLSSPEDWAQGLLRVRLEIPPGTDWSLPHYHTEMRERIVVERGLLSLYLRGRWQTCRPEDGWIEFDTGVAHGFRNRSTRPVVLVGEIEPFQTTDSAILATYALASEGRLGRWNLATHPLDIGILFELHRAFSPWLPRRVQVSVARFLVRLGQFVGHQLPRESPPRHEEELR